jgi:hypothetical protein
MAESRPPTDSGTADWAAQAADAVERAVDIARTKITNPALKLGRAVVYGTVIALLMLFVFPVLTIAAVRLLTIAFGRVWIADAAIGALFVLGGSWFWSKRSPATAKQG